MNKILFSVLILTTALISLTSISYAIFTSQVNIGDNTISTGNADLKIKDSNDSEWSTLLTGKNWANISPGWSDSYQFYLKNNSSAPISLKIFPQLRFKNYSNEDILNNINLEIDSADEMHSTGIWTLRQWADPENNIYLDQILTQYQEIGPWFLKFSVMPNVGNEIKNSTLNFDLIFNGQQIL